jgi:glutathione synthase/RimK-type ligase-like ATP-grasp enzyme
MSTRIAFATCAQFPVGGPDDVPLVAELQARGHVVAQRVWNRDPVDDVDVIVLRSCWDYHQDATGFRAWLAQHDGRILNPSAVAAWNLDKSYLEDLATRGVLVPATAWIRKGEPGSLREHLERKGIDAAVVKPVVSMGGWETWRTSLADAERDDAQFRALVSDRDVMVQAFAESVLDEGELSLVYFGGVFSHGVRKVPHGGEFRIHAEHGGRATLYEPVPHLLDVAARILDATPHAEPLLYARVDLVTSAAGPLLMELEVIDPELFFRFDVTAAARFADALEARL